MSESSHQSERSRRAEFTASGHVAAKLATRSGDIAVTTSTGSAIVVTLRLGMNAPASLLEESLIEFDADHQTLVVTSAAARETLASTLRSLRRGFLTSGTKDVDVIVELPDGSDLDVDTSSGDVVIHGTVGTATVNTASGDVAVDDAEDVTARTASGDVRVGTVRASLRAQSASGDVVVRDGAATTKVQSASGDVRVASAGAATDVSTASGDVVVGAAGSGTVAARTASGDVRISVAPGLEIDVEARSVSGDLSSAFDLSRDGGGGSGTEVLELRLATVSGDVAVVRA